MGKRTRFAVPVPNSLYTVLLKILVKRRVGVASLLVRAFGRKNGGSFFAPGYAVVGEEGAYRPFRYYLREYPEGT